MKTLSFTKQLFYLFTILILLDAYRCQIPVIGGGGGGSQSATPSSGAGNTGGSPADTPAPSSTANPATQPSASASPQPTNPQSSDGIIPTLLPQPTTTNQQPTPTTPSDNRPTNANPPYPTSDQGQTDSSYNPATPTTSSYNDNNSNRPSRSSNSVSRTSGSGNSPSSSDTGDQNNNANVPSNQQGQRPKDNAGSIAGGVVGGFVGIALIAGFATWLNRRGGCARRSRRRNNDDFENQMDNYAMNKPEKGTSDKMSPSSPFQHARRFVPPTTGYVNLQDEDCAYQNHSASSPAMVHEQDLGYQYPYPYQPQAPVFVPQPVSPHPPAGWQQTMKPDTVDGNYKPNEYQH
ncbi:hypothetical protein EC973_008263 [Apophysomyces ossiformis]|uniref:Uncharacterized protein n=1 Tax=Apophysomyces ossiformis TaxID=679940 RepID=A0A8H7BYL6_9FUNG|nr:hypothetical protein EC973_008263 [Apophysomyces ossiformis]